MGLLDVENTVPNKANRSTIMLPVQTVGVIRIVKHKTEDNDDV
jgi:hypothetical protein